MNKNIIKKIAILGATSHIAKGLIYNFLKDAKRENQHLFLFARRPEKVKSFLKENGLKGHCVVSGFRDFNKSAFDAIINCVGIGNPADLKDNIGSIFSLTEEFDNLIMKYVINHKNTCYLNFSSGAVYGNDFSEPAVNNYSRKLSVNNLKQEDYYGIAKLNSEMKHRAYGDLNIVDIRIFSYFSRFVDLEAGYFITDLISALKNDAEFVTDSSDFVRDYLHPLDLFRLIGLIIKKKGYNGAIDAYSSKPVNKFKILKYFTKEYGLRYKIKELDIYCPTGKKNPDYSSFYKARQFGYVPSFSSLETISGESKHLLEINE
jgi:nucleoside-diphosphate-sugar epimerase